ncbi:hypothetical protein EcCFBP13530_23175 [Enterobacter cancerogenus]|uniref:Integrase catalytic domain-containing protein n=1 Tax=Enterobacter cancerogenus TaxID=69218 RepID=A0AB38NY54_9ENTR|nr:hypothetical protein EcCFBP13530_23175 [Enterobacter cancerogenus]
MDFSRPGKPKDNPFTDSLDSSLLDECPNIHWFCHWRIYRTNSTNGQEYNHERTHSSLNDMAPAEFIRSIQKDKGL